MTKQAVLRARRVAYLLR